MLLLLLFAVCILSCSNEILFLSAVPWRWFGGGGGGEGRGERGEGGGEGRGCWNYLLLDLSHLLSITCVKNKTIFFTTSEYSFTKLLAFISLRCVGLRILGTFFPTHLKPISVQQRNIFIKIEN